MRSDTWTVRQIFQDRRQYCVPFYQRAYVWNQGEQWQFVSDLNDMLGVDGGSGEATVELDTDEAKQVKQAAARTKSNPGVDPTTGAELGMSGGMMAQEQGISGTPGSHSRH